jgi:hypothetical protein
MLKTNGASSPSLTSRSELDWHDCSIHLRRMRKDILRLIAGLELTR